MTTSLETITSQAIVLPPDQRMRLALALMESVETDDPVAAGEAWNVEIANRIDAYDSGQARGIPSDEVFRKLRAIAPDR